MVDYVVNLKINDKDFDKVKKELNTAKVNFSTSKTPLGTEQKSINNKVVSGIGGMLTKLGIIAAVLTVFKDLIEPLINIIKYFLFVMLAPILKPLLNWLNKQSPKELKERAGNLALESIGPIGQIVLNWDKIKSALATFGGWIKTAGVWVWNLIKKGFNGLLGVGKWLWDNIIIPAFQGLVGIGKWLWDNIILPAFKPISEWAVKIWDFFEKGFHKVLSFGKDIWKNYIVVGFKSALNWAKNIYDKYIEPAGKGIADAITWVKQKINNAWDSVKSAAERTKNWIESKLHPKEEGSEGFGGTIPTTGLYHLHSGERIITNNQTNNSTPNITLNVNVSGNLNDNLDDIARQLGERIRQYASW